MGIESMRKKAPEPTTNYDLDPDLVRAIEFMSTQDELINRMSRDLTNFSPNQIAAILGLLQHYMEGYRGLDRDAMNNVLEMCDRGLRTALQGGSLHGPIPQA